MCERTCCHQNLLRERCVEHLPHLGLQGREGKGLLEQVGSWFQHAVVANRIFGVARHIEHPGFGPHRGEAVGKFTPVHARHDDVRQQQVNRAWVSCRKLKGGHAVVGFKHGVSLLGQILARNVAEGIFIHHHQDDFAEWPGRSFLNCVLDGNRLARGRDPRQIDFENCSLARPAVNPDVAIILFDDAIYGGKPETGTFGSFRGEERLEDLRLRFCIHAQTSVTNGQHHELTGFHGRMHAGIAVVERDVAGFDGELAALGHGISRVDREIHDDLPDLAGIGLHGAEIRSRNHGQINVFSNHASEHLGVFSHHGVQVHDLGCNHLLAAEGEELAGECGCTLGGASNLLNQAAKLGVMGGALGEKFAVAGDHHEQIVEVMRNAAGQPAHRFHFLRLAKLLFQGPAFGYVFGEELEEERRFFFETYAFSGYGAAGKTDQYRFTVLGHPLGSQILEWPQGAQTIRHSEPLLRITMEVGKVLASEFSGGIIAQHLHQSRVGI